MNFPILYENFNTTNVTSPFALAHESFVTNSKTVSSSSIVFFILQNCYDLIFISCNAVMFIKFCRHTNVHLLEILNHVMMVFNFLTIWILSFVPLMQRNCGYIIWQFFYWYIYTIQNLYSCLL